MSHNKSAEYIKGKGFFFKYILMQNSYIFLNKNITGFVPTDIIWLCVYVYVWYAL